MTAVDDTVWFDIPGFFTPFDLGEDADDRIGRVLSNTPTLDHEERRTLVIQQELLVDRMRRNDVRYAATAAVRIEDDGPPRISVAQFTIAVHETAVSDHAFDAIGRRMRATMGAGVGFVDLPAGRALAVVNRRGVPSRATLTGRPRQRVHVVQQIQLIFPSPRRRHLAFLAIGTECVHDAGFYVDVLGTIGRSVSFSPPTPRARSVGTIMAALEPSVEKE